MQPLIRSDLGRGPSVPTAPEYAGSSHPVEMPIEALGRPAENKGGEDPTRSATDENGQRRRQVGQRAHENCPDESPGERHSGSD